MSVSPMDLRFYILALVPLLFLHENNNKTQHKRKGYHNYFTHIFKTVNFYIYYSVISFDRKITKTSISKLAFIVF